MRPCSVTERLEINTYPVKIRSTLGELSPSCCSEYGDEGNDH